MPPIFSTATVALCTGLMTFVVALILTTLCFYEKREKAVSWWAAGMWLFTFGFVSFMFRGTSFHWPIVVVGNCAILLGYASIWAGFVRFAGKPINRGIFFAGVVVWLFALQFEAIADSVSYRVMVLSLASSVYGLLSVIEAHGIWKREKLPFARLTSYFYFVHIVAFIVRLPLAYFYPISENALMNGSSWYFYAIVEGFVQGIFTSFACLILVRERSERRYRMAAEVDGLTKAATRRHFVNETGIALATKPKQAVLAVLDLDHFKHINDTYGHMAGDRVLVEFARTVMALLEPNMIFGRLGGEEFGLFIPSSDDVRVKEFLETLRMKVEALDISFNGNTLKITTSIGAASTEDVGFAFDHLLAGADDALYLCKDQGRNRVHLFAPMQRLHPILEEGEQTRLSLSKRRISRLSVRSRIGHPN